MFVSAVAGVNIVFLVCSMTNILYVYTMHYVTPDLCKSSLATNHSL